MKEKLQKLADALYYIDKNASKEILKIAGRYDKAISPMPELLQPAIKYIMYLKLMRGLDDSSFHYFKRKYRDTSQQIQDECQKELDALIMHDALSRKIPSSTIRNEFSKKLNEYIPTYIEEDS